MSIIYGNQLMEIMRNTLNKIDNRLIDHGTRVAYMVWKFACFDNTLNNKQIRDVTITSFLHDIGAYKTEEIDNMVEFETNDVLKHSIYGYLFLKYLAPLDRYARIILCHHLPYDHLKKYQFDDWRWSQILSIADRYDVAMAVYQDMDIAKQRLYIHEDTLFSRELLDLFFEADDTLHFLKDIFIDKKELSIDILINADHSEDELRSYLDMISYSIDFRSQFMMTHTMTTNRISLKIAELMNLSTSDKDKIDLGSILHDLGKVAIPVEILDFPGKLNSRQMNIMRKHVQHTAEILDTLIDEDTKQIAIRHHEKLNGSGYPLGLDDSDLTTNERIVAIADIISALYEQRSYKGAMSKETILQILKYNVEDNSLDKNIITLALEHYDEIIAYTKKECDPMIQTYKRISSMYQYICENYEAYLEELSKN